MKEIRRDKDLPSAGSHPNDHNSWIWAGLKAGVKSFSKVFHVDAGPKDLGQLLLFSHAISKAELEEEQLGT